MGDLVIFVNDVNLPLCPNWAKITQITKKSEKTATRINSLYGY